MPGHKLSTFGDIVYQTSLFTFEIEQHEAKSKAQKNRRQPEKETLRKQKKNLRKQMKTAMKKKKRDCTSFGEV